MVPGTADLDAAIGCTVGAEVGIENWLYNLIAAGCKPMYAVPKIPNRSHERRNAKL